MTPGQVFKRILNFPFGGEFGVFDLLAKPLRAAMRFQFPPNPAQRFDNLALPIAGYQHCLPQHRFVRSGEFCCGPRTPEQQIYIEAVRILKLKEIIFDTRRPISLRRPVPERMMRGYRRDPFPRSSPQRRVRAESIPTRSRTRPTD